MDPRLLKHYNLELQHLREMGAEFAQQFPKIAARLGMNGLEVADPYVERLLEGVGFMAARVQLKLEAEFPRFTQALLEIVYPHYLAPTPSMLVAQVSPDPKEPGLAAGTRVLPRGSTMRGLLGGEDVTACEFRTAHDVTLWPIELVSASYFSYAPDLPFNKLPVGPRIKGGVRLRLKTTAGLKFSQIGLDSLRFFLTGRDDVANKLYELSLGSPIGALVLPLKAATRWQEFLPATHVKPVGFADEEALLPVTLRSFQGYRLLQEYFTFPQRFRFFEIDGLGPSVRRVDGDELELVVLFQCLINNRRSRRYSVCRSRL
jgi:type VI secretion system protein ImpG